MTSKLAQSHLHPVVCFGLNVNKSSQNSTSRSGDSKESFDKAIFHFIRRFNFRPVVFYVPKKGEFA